MALIYISKQPVVSMLYQIPTNEFLKIIQILWLGITPSIQLSWRRMTIVIFKTKYSIFKQVLLEIF